MQPSKHHPSKAELASSLKLQITEYQNKYGEQDTADKFIALLNSCDDPFSRHSFPGHITCSAFAVKEDFKQLLLIHHRKLDKWIQPGGHFENDSDCISAARRELREECGIANPVCPDQEILDLDIHSIPKFGDVPEHFHYDVRFLFIVGDNSVIKLNSEVKNAEWVELDQLQTFTDELSVLRPANKILKFR